MKCTTVHPRRAVAVALVLVHLSRRWGIRGLGRYVSVYYVCCDGDANEGNRVNCSRPKRRIHMRRMRLRASRARPRRSRGRSSVSDVRIRRMVSLLFYILSHVSVFYMVLLESGLTCHSLSDVWKESGCKVFQRPADSPRTKVQFEVISPRFSHWLCI